MLPCLLLALALLGTAPASRPAPASPEAEVAALEVPEEEEEDARCPLASETRAFSLADPLAATTYRYVVVTRCQTIHSAERTCAQCYRGRLASIHSSRTNAFLQRQARLCTNRGQVWIGAVTRPRGRSVRCRWADGSRYNYAHWQRGFPLRSRRYCTALCTNNGRWRSLRCRVRLPFICEY
ncbi:bone marrow proteoglycan isoform X2 [Opisthocomus hoazin]|uniref:bone marrow proteoglycan isoform X2 n=1 Tax=Opisthocomus hoazin TaxID=30419 RepID=UPI003F53DD21